MRRLDKNRVVRFRYRLDNRIPAGAVGRVLKFKQDTSGLDYTVQLPRGFNGHNAGGLLRTNTGYYVSRDILESTRVKVSGSAEFNRRYKFTPAVEGACVTKA